MRCLVASRWGWVYARRHVRADDELPDDGYVVHFTKRPVPGTVWSLLLCALRNRASPSSLAIARLPATSAARLILCSVIFFSRGDAYAGNENSEDFQRVG